MRLSRKNIESKRLSSWRPAPRRRGIYFFLVVACFLTTVFFSQFAFVAEMISWLAWLVLLILAILWFLIIATAIAKDVAEERTPKVKIGSAPPYPCKKFVPRNFAHMLTYTDDDGNEHQRNVVSEFLPTGAYQDLPGNDGHPSPLIVATAYDDREEESKKENRSGIEVPSEVTTQRKGGILGRLKDKVIGGPIDSQHIFAGRFQGEQYFIPCEPILITVQDLPPDMRRFALGLGVEGAILEWTPVLWGPDRMDEPHKVPVSYESNLAWQYQDTNRQLEDERIKNELLKEELMELYQLRGTWREPKENLSGAIR